MRHLFGLLGAACLAACAGGDDRERTVVELDGVPVTVLFDAEDKSRATARLSSGDAGSDADLEQAVVRGTGCVIAQPPNMRLIVYKDGGRGIEISTDCSKAPPPGTIDREASRRLAEEIERGVQSVTSSGVPVLFEGSPISAFTKAQIQSFCDQGWETRASANGRTEYNPCTRKDAFR